VVLILEDMVSSMTTLATDYAGALVTAAVAIIGLVGGYFGVRYGVPALIKFIKSVLK
jgi:hypothetical protein